MNKIDELLKRRLLDRDKEASRKGIVTFSDYLNLNELNICHNMSNMFSCVSQESFGGYDLAERQIIAFIPDALYYEWEFPIACLKIVPLHSKFSEALSHRDYLGAVLKLGIDRSKLGDILVDKDQAFLFCIDQMAGFICKELVRVRHTAVLCKREEPKELSIPIRTESIHGTVASIRLDSVIALACGGSRSGLVKLIEGGKVFVNGKQILSNGYTPKEQDLISVRGVGKFRYCSILTKTKKGRYYIEIEKFI